MTYTMIFPFVVRAGDVLESAALVWELKASESRFIGCAAIIHEHEHRVPDKEGICSEPSSLQCCPFSHRAMLKKKSDRHT